MRFLNRLFQIAENTIDPFAPRRETEPPSQFAEFVWFYVRQAKWAFAAMLLLGFLNAGVEALVFTFVGEIVDILTEFAPNRETGWSGLLAAAAPVFARMLPLALTGRVLIVPAGAPTVA